MVVADLIFLLLCGFAQFQMVPEESVFVGKIITLLDDSLSLQQEKII